MFYRNPNPEHKFARRNGYTPHSFITNGLVLYLPLWALKGDKIRSVDAYRHIGDITGALWRDNGRWFDGVNDAIDFATSTILQTRDNITVEAWFNTSDVTRLQAPVGRWNGVDQWVLKMSASKMNVAVNTAGGKYEQTGNGALTNDTWHHAALTYLASDGLFSVYLDGVLDEEMATDGNVLSASTGYLSVGSSGESSQWYLGLIGEVRYYTRKLSLAELQHNRNCTKGGTHN